MTKKKKTEEEENKISPFDHVKDIYKRGSKFQGDEGYVQFIINKELSNNGEVIDLVNLVQQYWSPMLDNKLHFKVMNAVFPYSKRPYVKWMWGGPRKVEPIIEVISKHFNESIKNSKVYYQILKSSKEGKKQLKYLKRVYGLENK